MDSKLKVLNGLVEFTPSENINHHGMALSKVIETMSRDMIDGSKFSKFALEEAFVGLTVTCLDGTSDMSITSKGGSTKQFIELLLFGFDRLSKRFKHEYELIQVRVSVPKKMPSIERKMMFEYFDAAIAELENYKVVYTNTDKSVVSYSNGVKIMSYC